MRISLFKILGAAIITIVGTFLGRAFIALIDLLEMDPSKRLAEWVFGMIATPTPEQVSFIRWGLAALIGLMILVIWKVIERRKKPISPQPNITIASAIDYIVNDSKTEFPPSRQKLDDGRMVVIDGLEHSEAIKMINEAAIDGRITLWGRRQILRHRRQLVFEDTIRKILKKYWDDARLDYLSPLQEFTIRDFPQTEPLSTNAQTPTYTGIKLNKQELYEVWPRKPLWRRIQEKLEGRKRITYP